MIIKQESKWPYFNHNNVKLKCGYTLIVHLIYSLKLIQQLICDQKQLWVSFIEYKWLS